MSKKRVVIVEPLLYQVATAGLEQESIAHSVRAMARSWAGTRFKLTEWVWYYWFHERQVRLITRREAVHSVAPGTS